GAAPRRVRIGRDLPPDQHADAAQSVDREFPRSLRDIAAVSARRRCAGRADADGRARRRPPPAGDRGGGRGGGVAAPPISERAGPAMDFSLSPEQQQIRDSIAKLCAQFDDGYWLEKDRSGAFPHELHAALAQAGWLGIAMPEEYGGAGLGVTEAAIMMQTIAESGAAMTGASAVHINIFGLQPVVVFGTDEQRRRMLPPLIAGKDKACFAVTEPDAGLDTTALKVRAERRGDRYL